MTQITFSRSLLHDIDALKGWLTHTSHLTPIRASSLPTGQRLLKERWQMHWLEVLSYLHEKIFSAALKAIQVGCVNLGATSLAKRVELVNLHFNATKSHLLAVRTHKEALLSLSRNCHHLGSSEIYLQEPLPFSSIQDSRVRSLVNDKAKDSQIVFFHNAGVCRGMCFWFVYLYFTSLPQFSDRISHITAVAKQFEEGAPPPATLLHSLLSVENPLLSLQGEAREMLFTSFENDQTSFAKYPPGIYSLGLGRHRINYIKFSENEAVIFDPNVGTWLIRGNQQSERAHQYICKIAKDFGAQSRDDGKIRISYCTGIES